jgi:hypothetical protein
MTDINTSNTTRIRIMSRSTDRTRIEAAFQALRAHGIAAESDYACCQTCGWAQFALDHGAETPAVYFDAQSANAFRIAYGSLYGPKTPNLHRSMALYWKGAHTPRLVRIELANVGLAVEHDGNPKKALLVLPRTKETRS